MTVNEISARVNATLLTGAAHLDGEISRAFGSDMMSDALAYADSHTILLTGLCNLQVLRTAEMLDIPVILFVRGKQPRRGHAGAGGGKRHLPSDDPADHVQFLRAFYMKPA